MKTMISKAKRALLGDSQPFDLSRRQVIKGAAGLAAVTIATSAFPGVLGHLGVMESYGLQQQLRSGARIDNLVLLVDKPLVIEDVSDLWVENLTVILREPAPAGMAMIYFRRTCRDITIGTLSLYNGMDEFTRALERERRA